MSHALLASEIWIHIIAISDNCDINSISRTSKRFYRLAVDLLYERITWRDPRTLAQSISRWKSRKNALFRSIPRRLNVSVSPLRCTDPLTPPYQTSVVNLHGKMQQLRPFSPSNQLYALARPRARAITPNQPHSIASAALYRMLTDRIRSFKMLHDLTFQQAFIPDEFHNILHDLPVLKRLEVSSCVLSRKVYSVNHRSLPITSLILRDILGVLVHEHDNNGNTNVNLMASLVLGQRIEVLDVDFSCRVLPYLLFHCRHPIQNVRHLTIGPQGPPTSTNFFHNLNENNPRAHILSEFLKICPAVAHLELQGNIARDLTLTDGALPNLRSYAGDRDVLVKITANSTVDHVKITGSSDWPGLVKALQTFAISQKALNTLEFCVNHWDNDILYALPAEFPNLQRLRISYRSGAPSMNMLVGLGSHFLTPLQSLESLHLYKSMTDSIDHLMPQRERVLDNNGIPITIDWETEGEDVEDSQEYLDEFPLSWRLSSKIKEIRLVRSFLWRRNSRDQWLRWPCEKEAEDIRVAIT